MNANEPKELSWIRSVVRIRKRLVISGKSRKNDTGTLKALDEISNDISMIPFRTSDQVKNYIRRKSDKIKLLLPGSGSTSCRKKNNEFLTIIST